MISSKSPVEAQTPANPAEPANPGQNPVKPAEPGNLGKNETPSKSETPTEPSKPADSLNKGNPTEETPSGTKPADPGENPAEPGNKGEPNGDKELKDSAKSDDSGKNAKDKKDKNDKDSKGKKDKSGKGGDSGGGKGVPAPKGGASRLGPAAGAAGGGLIGGMLPGGKKEAKKEEKPGKPAKSALKEVAASSETVRKAEPVQASTQATVAGSLYSAGKGERIAVIDFEGESGAEFAALLSSALSSDLKVYDPKKLAAKKYTAAAINGISVRKIASEIGVEYLVTGKVSKKTSTLSIISIFLRDGQTGDTKMTDNQNIRSSGDLETAVRNAAGKIKENINP